MGHTEIKSDGDWIYQAVIPTGIDQKKSVDEYYKKYGKDNVKLSDDSGEHVILLFVKRGALKVYKG